MIKLHLGCGRRDFGPDWTHIDGGDFEHLEHHDITNLPYNDESVDVIYASHVLEYFDREEAVDVLREWRRVLKKGATLRIAVPDFEVMARLYIKRGYELRRFLGPIFGKIKMAAKTVYHKTIYDFEDMQSLLTGCEFHSVKRYDWRETEHGHIDDCSQAYLPHMDKENGTLISLNVECLK
jgi:predicted SAM-dependent methyltransferase